MKYKKGTIRVEQNAEDGNDTYSIHLPDRRQIDKVFVNGNRVFDKLALTQAHQDGIREALAEVEEIDVLTEEELHDIKTALQNKLK